ncbi:MAG: DUF4129 domain-containing protein [Thermoanaerobaculia bacterium]
MRKWIVIAAMLTAAEAAASTQVTLSQYVAALENIRAAVAANQLESAKTQANELAKTDVLWPHGTFHADEALLNEVGQVTRADRALLARLELTIAEIRASHVIDNKPPDPKLLQQVAAEQDVPELAPGGEIVTVINKDVPLIERIANSIAAMWRWLSEKIGKLLEWFVDLLPGSSPPQKSATSGMRWIVIALVTLIVILVVLLAIEVVRRSRRAQPEMIASAEAIGSKKDDDPLSRGATEWERYALQLAAAGKFREAIRAWYHAVLVTCYASGILHFRKGRTNWEYVAALAPSLGWRPEMIELTRRFEQEWYGLHQSTPDALDECSTRARSILGALRGAA